jgi:hypothetical protein
MADFNTRPIQPMSSSAYGGCGTGGSGTGGDSTNTNTGGDSTNTNTYTNNFYITRESATFICNHRTFTNI